ncbi:hypothetical protein M405DRAFT_846552 [Rhizopogon salebrosus TDB-379]|nr:hypothetical protein M405DRAFT_846552 [Rhizopogon salebrosus TDB-379]
MASRRNAKTTTAITAFVGRCWCAPATQCLQTMEQRAATSTYPIFWIILRIHGATAGMREPGLDIPNPFLHRTLRLSVTHGSTASSSFNISVADAGGGISSTTTIFVRVPGGTIERRESMRNDTGGLGDSMEDSNLAPCKSWSNPWADGDLIWIPRVGFVLVYGTVGRRTGDGKRWVEVTSAQVVRILSQLEPDDTPNEYQVAHGKVLTFETLYAPCLTSCASRYLGAVDVSILTVTEIAWSLVSALLVSGCRAPHDYFFRFALKSSGNRTIYEKQIVFLARIEARLRLGFLVAHDHQIKSNDDSLFLKLPEGCILLTVESYCSICKVHIHAGLMYGTNALIDSRLDGSRGMLAKISGLLLLLGSNLYEAYSDPEQPGKLS